MNVLWITNIALPEALELLHGKGVLKSSGGWLIGAAEALCKQPDIQLTIATVSRDVTRLTRLEGKSITYYLLPFGKGNNKVNHAYEPFWQQVNKEVNPDVVHLHGTEFSHGLAYLEACGSEHVCVSIQGLTSAYYYYYYYGISRNEIRKAFTLRSLLQGGILKGYNEFKQRGEVEKDILRRVHHVIGRTSWDRERTWAINPHAQYHYGGETLRPEFYTTPKWEYANCTPHSIFLSQAFYPIKGLHMVLKAMPLVLRHYPNTKIRVAGPDIARTKGGLELLKLSNYGMIIRRMIKKYELEDVISFTGALDGEGMKREYLNCNVFVCPSSIENSPNSLGEAQILGVPVVASYVGGVMDMMKGDEEHLYRFEEIEMLAYKICDIFKHGAKIDTVSMRQVALQRHDPEKNVKELIDTYRLVSKE